MTVIPIAIGALETILKVLVRWLEHCNDRLDFKGLQEISSVNAGVKNSNNNNNNVEIITKIKI